MPIRKRISLQDIADRARVSRMAVSLALRDDPRISEKTRSRIREIANDLGYQPDPALQALNAYRKTKVAPRFFGCMAFLNGFEAPVKERTWMYYGRYFLGARRRAQEMGFRVEEIWLGEPGMNVRTAERILKARGISAILVSPQREARGTLDLDWDRYSAVALGRSLESPKLHVVANSQFQSMVTLFRSLRSLGYQRIAFLFETNQDERVENRWLGGYLSAQYKYSRPEDRIPPLLFNDDCSGFLRDWFQEARPDAIITGDGALHLRLPEMGIRVPDDVGVARPFSSGRESSVACIEEHSEEIGAAAVDFLASMTYRNERGIPDLPTNTLLPGCFKAGTTVRRVQPSG